MPEAALFTVLALGLCTLGLALGLWGLLRERRERRALQAHLAHWIDAQQLPVAVGAPAEAAAEPLAGLPAAGWMPTVLDGLVTPVQLLGLAAAIAGAAALTAGLWHWLSAAVLAVVLVLLAALVLAVRWQRRRQRTVGQLPGFLDAMVRLVTIGHSTQAAFQMAAASAKPPLQAVVERAGGLARAGMELEDAVALLGRQQRINELRLLAAVLRVSVRYGGRSDVLLERVAHFMRDREQAGQELTAMTAEVRLSAWVLSLLPLVVGGLIVFFNAGYFVRMWSDEAGQQLIVLGALLQVAGVLLLVRLARVE